MDGAELLSLDPTNGASDGWAYISGEFSANGIWPRCEKAVDKSFLIQDRQGY